MTGAWLARHCGICGFSPGRDPAGPQGLTEATISRQGSRQIVPDLEA